MPKKERKKEKREVPEDLVSLRSFAEKFGIDIDQEAPTISVDYLTDRFKLFPDLAKKLNKDTKGAKIEDIKLEHVFTQMDLLFSGKGSSETTYEELEFLFELSIYLKPLDNSKARIGNLRTLNKFTRQIINNVLFLQDADYVTNDMLKDGSKDYVAIENPMGGNDIDFITKNAQSILNIYFLIKPTLESTNIEDSFPESSMDMLFSKAILSNDIEMVKRVIALFIKTELKYKANQKDDVDLEKLQRFACSSLTKKCGNLTLVAKSCKSVEFFVLFANMIKGLDVGIDEPGLDETTAIHVAMRSFQGTYKKLVRRKTYGFAIDDEGIASLRLSFSMIKTLLALGADPMKDHEKFKISQSITNWIIDLNKMNDQEWERTVLKPFKNISYFEKGLAKWIAVDNHSYCPDIDLEGLPISILDANVIESSHKYNPDGTLLTLREIGRFDDLPGNNLHDLVGISKIFNHNIAAFIYLCTKMCKDGAKISDINHVDLNFGRVSQEMTERIDRAIANGQDFEFGVALCRKILKTKDVLKGAAPNRKHLDDVEEFLRAILANLNGKAVSLSGQMIVDGIAGIDHGNLKKSEDVKLICESLEKNFEYFKTVPHTIFNRNKFIALLNLVNKIARNKPVISYAGSDGKEKTNLDLITFISLNTKDLPISFQKHVHRIFRGEIPKKLLTKDSYRKVILDNIEDLTYESVDLQVSDSQTSGDINESDEVILSAARKCAECQINLNEEIKKGAVTKDILDRHNLAARILARLVDHLDPASDEKAFSLLEKIISTGNKDRPLNLQEISALLEVGFINNDQILRFLGANPLPEELDFVSNIRSLADNYYTPIVDLDNDMTRAKRAILYCNNDHLSEILNDLIEGSRGGDLQIVCEEIITLPRFLNLNFENQRLNLVISALASGLEKADGLRDNPNMQDLAIKLANNIVNLKPLTDSIIFTIHRLKINPFAQCPDQEQSILESLIDDKLTFQDSKAKSILMKYLFTHPNIKNIEINDELALKIIRMIISYPLGNESTDILKSFLVNSGYEFSEPDFKSSTPNPVKEILLSGFLPFIQIMKNHVKSTLSKNAVEEFLKENTLFNAVKITGIVDTATMSKKVPPKDVKKPDPEKTPKPPKKKKAKKKIPKSTVEALAGEGLPPKKKVANVVENTANKLHKRIDAVEDNLNSTSDSLKSIQERIEKIKIRTAAYEEGVREDLRLKEIEEERNKKIQELAQKPIEKLIEMLVTGDEDGSIKEAMVLRDQKLAEANRGIPQLVKNNHDWRRQVELDMQRINHLEEASNALFTDNEALETQNKQLNDRITEALEEKATLWSDLNELKSKMEDLQKQHEDLGGEKNKIADRLGNARRNLRDSRDRAESAAATEVKDEDVSSQESQEERLEMARQEGRDEASEEIVELKRNIETMTRDLRRRGAEIDSLKSQGDALDASIRELEISKRELNRKFNEYKRESRAGLLPTPDMHYYGSDHRGAPADGHREQGSWIERDPYGHQHVTMPQQPQPQFFAGSDGFYHVVNRGYIGTHMTSNRSARPYVLEDGKRIYNPFAGEIQPLAGQIPTHGESELDEKLFSEELRSNMRSEGGVAALTPPQSTLPPTAEEKPRTPSPTPGAANGEGIDGGNRDLGK